MNPASNLTERTVGDVVAADYRTAAVFEKHGVDFCCGGKDTISAVCQAKGLDPARLVEELQAVQVTPVARSENYTAWSLSFLIDYIVNNHHSYVDENLSPIAGYAHKIAEVHGARHPELIEIAAIFDRLAAALTQHLREEEAVFFPAVKRAEAARQAGNEPDAGDLETIRRMLEQFGPEHEEVGDAIHQIRHLSQGFVLPSDACNTYMLAYQKPKEFEDDIHKHVHLENNILFPKSAAL